MAWEIRGLGQGPGRGLVLEPGLALGPEPALGLVLGLGLGLEAALRRGGRPDRS
jgi:hypothetical protein